uniref:BTB domain-containing protein n=1 Tax=Steinernema glaseri TaxID=37863 RepID=A0A1I7YG36_9BILA
MSGKRYYVFEVVINKYDFDTNDEFASDVQKVVDKLDVKLKCRKLQNNQLDIRLHVQNMYLLKWSQIKYALTISKDSSDSNPETLVGITTFTYFVDLFLMYVNQPENYIGPTTSMHVKLEMCMYRSVFYDLSTFSPHYADFPIKLDSGEQLYVSKSVLSNHSPFFNTYFNSTEFNEYSEGVYELKETSYWPFFALLHVLYGIEFHCGLLFEEELIATMELAHRFQCDLAMRYFENYLLCFPDDNLKHWFDLAERYQMMELLRRIISTMTKEELKAIMPSNTFLGNLHPDTVQEVVGRLLDL